MGKDVVTACVALLCLFGVAAVTAGTALGAYSRTRDELNGVRMQLEHATARAEQEAAAKERWERRATDALQAATVWRDTSDAVTTRWKRCEEYRR